MKTQSRLTLMIALLVEFIVSTFMGNTAQALLIGLCAGVVALFVVWVVTGLVERK